MGYASAPSQYKDFPYSVGWAHMFALQSDGSVLVLVEAVARSQGGGEGG